MNLLTQVREQLGNLTMTHGGRNLETILEKAQKEEWTALKLLHELFATEINGRQDKARERRLKAANLPYIKSLDDFDFAFQNSISKRHMKQLADMAWLEGAYNIMFLGPPGVGKTHLAVALGLAAIDAGYRVHFTQMDDLIHVLKTEAISSKSRQKLKNLYNASLVILDEVGFQPITRQEANMLFALINRLYQQTSLILTSNKGFEEWGEFLGDPVITSAMLDRLMHKCELFNMTGDSFRLKHRERILQD
jgi:DNA replication protein DnaC